MGVLCLIELVILILTAISVAQKLNRSLFHGVIVDVRL